MNKFVECNNHIAEIRPDRMWRCIAKTDPFELLKNQQWKEDVPIDTRGSFESLIKSRYAEVINIEQLIEMNFEYFV
jgi:hypothetical protein